MVLNSCQCVSNLSYLNFKKSLIIHELTHRAIKANHSHEEVFICDKTHVDFHKTFASNFSAYTTSILKILSQTNWQDGYKMDRFWSYLKYSQFVLYQIKNSCSYSLVSRDVINFTGGQIQIDAQSLEGNNFSLYVLPFCLAANMCNFVRFVLSST